MREIVVLVGIPGSGKSTLATTTFANYTRVNLDSINHSRSTEAQIMKSTNNSIVIDNTDITVKSRERYIKFARAHNIPIRAILLAIKPKTAVNRISKRERKVPPFVVYTYARRLEIPSVYEGFSSVEVINEEVK
jgi:bifunctional polynucleotide phosphatase/kinase